MASKIKVDQIDTTLGSGNVTIDPDNNTLVVDTDNSRVGIGKSSPTQALSLYANDTTDTQLIIEQDSTGDAGIQFSLTGVKNWTVGVDNSEGDKFKIENGNAIGGSNDFVIDSTGKVGIGTTNPDAAGLTISSGGGEMIHLISSHSNKAHIEAESSGGSMWRIGTLDSNPDVTLQAMNSNGDIRFETNGGDDAFLIQNDGAFRGKLLFNGTPNFGPNGTWTSTGQSLSSYPNATVFQITVNMQGIGLYTAAMLVYKTSNGQYFEMSNVSNSGINIRLNGTNIETNQTSGANQTGSAGNLRIAYGGGQFA